MFQKGEKDMVSPRQWFDEEIIADPESVSVQGRGKTRTLHFNGRIANDTSGHIYKFWYRFSGNLNVDMWFPDYYHCGIRGWLLIAGLESFYGNGEIDIFRGVEVKRLETFAYYRWLKSGMPA